MTLKINQNFTKSSRIKIRKKKKKNDRSENTPLSKDNTKIFQAQSENQGEERDKRGK
jgi:hypothetical protein